MQVLVHSNEGLGRCFQVLEFSQARTTATDQLLTRLTHEPRALLRCVWRSLVHRSCTYKRGRERLLHTLWTADRDSNNGRWQGGGGPRLLCDISNQSQGEMNAVQKGAHLSNTEADYDVCFVTLYVGPELEYRELGAD